MENSQADKFNPDIIDSLSKIEKQLDPMYNTAHLLIACYSFLRL